MLPPTPPQTPLAVEIRGLRQRYETGFFRRGVDVLHDLDVTMRAGEFVGLVGPNGSGKSTLMRVLAGVDEASAGHVRVFGFDPDDSRARRRTGFCPEDSPFPPELKALATLEVIGSLYGIDRNVRRERARILLERVGLNHASHKPLGGFSRGMLRRFGLAQALLHEPDLILLDEPTAGLDALGFEVVEDLLGEARARGATLLVSSHLLSDLHQRCERLIVLVDGRILTQGSALDLVRELGERAALEVAVTGLDARALEALRAEVERLGGRVLGVQPAQNNLIELYRRGRAGGST